MLWDIDLIFDIWNYKDELQIKFNFCSHWIILAKLLSLDFIILHSIYVSGRQKMLIAKVANHHFFS